MVAKVPGWATAAAGWHRPLGPGGPGNPEPASAFHGHPQSLWQSVRPHPRLGPCQVPWLLSPVTFTGWEVAAET